LKRESCTGERGGLFPPKKRILIAPLFCPLSWGKKGETPPEKKKGEKRSIS